MISCQYLPFFYKEILRHGGEWLWAFLRLSGILHYVMDDDNFSVGTERTAERVERLALLSDELDLLDNSLRNFAQWL